MDPATRVCPFCGRPPGAGMFCAACGRNLTHVERLPTAAEAAERAASPGVQAHLATATAQFLDDMRTAGYPGVVEVPVGKPRVFRRTPRVKGWIVRPVDREDFEEPRRYRSGLLLTVDGRFHRLDTELRGWGQRDFPRYEHRVSPEPVDLAPDETLLEQLERLRAENLR